MRPNLVDNIVFGTPFGSLPFFCRSSVASKGRDTSDAIRQRDAIFRFLLTDNFDPNLNFPNI
jgi:hypothetical protein